VAITANVISKLVSVSVRRDFMARPVMISVTNKYVPLSLSLALALIPIKDELAVVHDGPFFTGTVLRALAIRSPSEEFNLLDLGHSINPSHANTSVTRIRGDGLMEHRGDIQLQGHLSITAPHTATKKTLVALSYHLDGKKGGPKGTEPRTMVSCPALSSRPHSLALSSPLHLSCLSSSLCTVD
jgi:hypothetical protein